MAAIQFGGFSLKDPCTWTFVLCSQYWAHVSTKYGQSCSIVCVALVMNYLPQDKIMQTGGSDFFPQEPISSSNRART